MEMLVIGVIAIVAFAAVLIPLFRRKPGLGDAREFEATTDVAPEPAGPVETTTGEPAGSAGVPDAADDLELEVERYRTAVRAGTVCRKCGQANPAESMFCFDCGERLPRDEAKEFE